MLALYPQLGPDGCGNGLPRIFDRLVIVSPMVMTATRTVNVLVVIVSAAGAVDMRRVVVFVIVSAPRTVDVAGIMGFVILRVAERGMQPLLDGN